MPRGGYLVGPESCGTAQMLDTARVSTISAAGQDTGHGQRPRPCRSGGPRGGVHVHRTVRVEGAAKQISGTQRSRIRLYTGGRVAALVLYGDSDPRGRTAGRTCVRRYEAMRSCTHAVSVRTGGRTPCPGTRAATTPTPFRFASSPSTKALAGQPPELIIRSSRGGATLALDLGLVWFFMF